MLERLLSVEIRCRRFRLSKTACLVTGSTQRRISSLRDRCLPGPSPLFRDATWPFFRRGSRIRRSVGSLSRCGVMEIVFYAGLLLFVLFGPWILVWRMNRGRKQNREEDQSRLRELINRVLALELGLKELRGRAAPPLRPNPVTKEAPVPELPTPPPAAPEGPAQLAGVYCEYSPEPLHIPAKSFHP